MTRRLAPVDIHLIPNYLGTHGTGLNLAVPVFAHLATPARECHLYSTPEDTETGVVCGRCSDHREVPVRHAGVEHVRKCHALDVEAAAEHAAEIWAEGGFLRWAEGGWDLTGAYSAELHFSY